MGRSQLQYRSSRGRGQQNSARGGRGGRGSAAPADDSASAKPKRSGGRSLGSNAFRYTEHDQNIAGDDDDETAANTSLTNTRRQFFAGEENYRDMGHVKESYFRTKAVQRWEADDDDDDDDSATRVAASTVGVMDFAWIAEQLAAVSPSLRYEIDPKYCADFSFEQPVDDERHNQEAAEVAAAQSGSLSTMDVDAQTTRTSLEHAAHASSASPLDDLLALSASIATSHPASVSSTTRQSSLPAVVPSNGDDAQENLEDWLDDVLDM